LPGDHQGVAQQPGVDGGQHGTSVGLPLGEGAGWLQVAMDCGRRSRPLLLAPATPLRRPTRIDDRACLAMYYLPVGRVGGPQAPPGQGLRTTHAAGGRCAGAGITPRIARHAIQSSGRLGRHRYVVEGSLTWLVGCPRVQVGDERHADILLGFVHLCCALSCLKSLNRIPV
jgi:hypothetical protein